MVGLCGPKLKKYLTFLAVIFAHCVQCTDKRTDPCSRLLCISLKFLALKNGFFIFSGSKKKFVLKIFNFFFYASFQCGRYNVKKKNFAHKKLKKSGSELAQTLLFHSPAQANGPQPKFDFPCYEISGQ